MNLRMLRYVCWYFLAMIVLGEELIRLKFTNWLTPETDGM